MNTDLSKWTAKWNSDGPLRTIVIAPGPEVRPTKLVVLCHGYGANALDLASLAEALLGQFQEIGETPVFLFPDGHHDLDEAGIPGGRAWWPLNMARLMELAEKQSFEEMRTEVPPEIDEARELICETVATALQEFDLSCDDWIQGGFSQGAMLSVDVALRGSVGSPKGLAVFSGALICENEWRPRAERLKKTSVLQSHGTVDSILPIQTGRLLRDLLEPSAANMRYIEFMGPHTIPMKVIENFVEETR